MLSLQRHTSPFIMAIGKAIDIVSHHVREESGDKRD